VSHLVSVPPAAILILKMFLRGEERNFIYEKNILSASKFLTISNFQEYNEV
jgi:hypothetical protein